MYLNLFHLQNLIKLPTFLNQDQISLLLKLKDANDLIRNEQPNFRDFLFNRC